MSPDYTPTRLTERRNPPRIAETHVPSPFHVVSVLRVLSLLVVRLIFHALRRTPSRTRAQVVRRELERLGSFWIKAGQLFSMRYDLFSAEFCEELAKLQDVAPGAEFRFTRATVEEELGARIEDIFSEFSEVPFAAASIAQLHLARLRVSGTQVAVKVQKPFVAQVMSYDLRVVYVISRICIALNILKFYNWEEFYVELERIVGEEVDYRYEAAAMRQMRKKLKAHGVIVPRPYRDLCTGRLLVMEYISGCLLADYFRIRTAEPESVEAWNQLNNVDPKKVVKRLFTSHLRQLFEDNLFHGDLHPGNIVLLKDSRIALLDFGSVGRLDATFHDTFLRYNQAVADGNLTHAADLFLLMAPSLPATDLARPRQEFIRLVRQWTLLGETPGIPGKERSYSQLMNRIMQLMARYGIPVAWDMFRVNRSKVSLDAAAQGLHPDYREVVITKRYFREARERRLQAGLHPTNLFKRTAEATAAMSKLVTTGAEAANLELAWMRRRAQTLILASSKASTVLVIGIDLLILGGFGASGALGLLWLHQRGLYQAPPELSATLNSVVRLTTGDWALIAVVCALVLARLLAARNQIRQTNRSTNVFS